MHPIVYIYIYCICIYMVLEFLPHLFGEEIDVPTMQSGQPPSNEAVLKELD